MWVNPGQHTNLNGQQSYLLFDSSTIQDVDPNKQTCVTASSLEADTTAGESTYYWANVLQNQVCNGPGVCNFSGLSANPGTISYASAVTTSPPGSDPGRPMDSLSG